MTVVAVGSTARGCIAAAIITTAGIRRIGIVDFIAGTPSTIVRSVGIATPVVIVASSPCACARRGPRPLHGPLSRRGTLLVFVLFFFCIVVVVIPLVLFLVIVVVVMVTTVATIAATTTSTTAATGG